MEGGRYTHHGTGHGREAIHHPGMYYPMYTLGIPCIYHCQPPYCMSAEPVSVTGKRGPGLNRENNKVKGRHNEAFLLKVLKVLYSLRADPSVSRVRNIG